MQSVTSGFAALIISMNPVLTAALAALLLGERMTRAKLAGYLLWFDMLDRLGASAASALHFLVPPIGLLLGWAVLGEQVPPLDLLGVVPRSRSASGWSPKKRRRAEHRLRLAARIASIASPKTRSKSPAMRA